MGFPWTRRTLHEFENGRRDLSAEELMAMPFLVDGVQLPEIIEKGGGAAWIRITEAWTVPARDVARILRGEVPHEVLGFAEPAAASRATTSDSEWKAARKLGISPDELIDAAFNLWGHRLPDERDRRLVLELNALGYSETKTSSPWSVQALRGHITRALLDELRTALAGKETG